MVDPVKLRALSEGLWGRTRATREHLHAHPELSFQEHETQAFVIERLRELGLEPQPVARTGVMALIRGRGGGERDGLVVLRADMDALPIQEESSAPYRSKKPGVMHACGHDVHTASLLTTTELLVGLVDEFAGTIRVIFQPGEERIPGGAPDMIAGGALAPVTLGRPTPSAVVGQHVMPLLEAGLVGFRSGLYMASADEIYLTLRGKGGHGAMPDRCIDPVAGMAQLLVTLQQIVSRRADPRMPTVLSFGRVEALGATNVIPEVVRLEGTFRTLDEGWRDQAHALIEQTVDGVTKALGIEASLEIRRGYPHLRNNPALTARLREGAVGYMGAEAVRDLDVWMAAEDFAYYSHKAPACFYRLGTANAARGITSGVHTPTFDIDPAALEQGPGLMAWLALVGLTHGGNFDA